MDEKNLNKNQKQAVEQVHEPLLIVAGAGTGKTTVLIERLNFLITNKLASAEEVLLITFTEKAAGELEERADRILPYGYVDLWINTFHGFCKRILNDHALEIGLPGSFKVMTQTEQWMFIKKNLEKFDLDYYKPLGNPTKFIHELIKHFSKLKDEYVSSSEYLKYVQKLKEGLDGMVSGDEKLESKAKSQNDKSKVNNKRSLVELRLMESGADIDAVEVARISELANAYQEYNRLLLENNFLDFGDLIVYVLKLFKERPNILKYYQKKFKYVMVDEFQDTNWAQYELIKVLVGKENVNNEKQSVHKKNILKSKIENRKSINLMVVGDDNQSIYKFRGASLSNIMQFKDDFPEAKTIVLNDNYRSGQNILDKSYDFIKFNDPNTLEAKLGISKKLKSHKKHKGEVEVLRFETEMDEARGVAQKIVELYKQSNALRLNEPPSQEGILWSDFSILVRANSTASLFVNELTKEGVPNLFVSMRGLYYKPMILDILAYMKLLDNYHESSALFRVLNNEVFKVSYKDIIEINKIARKKVWSTFETLLNINAAKGISAESVMNINKLVAFIQKHSELSRNWKASSLFVRVIKETGVIDHLDHDKDFEIFGQLNQFYNHIKSYEQTDPNFSTKDLLNAVELELESGETGSLKLPMDDDDKVKIMTIHSAKGLEFKYVFVVGLVDKRFPTITKKDKIPIPSELVKEFVLEGDTHVEEERRLFYVAITRAKEKLFLTWGQDYGGTTLKKPSKFLLEAGFEEKNDDTARVGAMKYNLWEEMVTLDKKELLFESYKIHLPKRFSFSQIEAYTKCPLQYKFSFILKIPADDKPSLNFGRVMHNTLNQFFSPLVNIDTVQQNLFGGMKKEEIKKPTRAHLLSIYGEYWNPDGFRSKKEREEYYKKGKDILNGFFDKLEQEEWPAVAMLEKSFNIKIGGYLFKGAIDRIDYLEDGTYEIIDYKTGSPKEKITFEHKRQLILYKYAVEEIFKKKVSKLSFYYLENNSILSFKSDDKQIEKLREQIIGKINGIKDCNFAPTPGIICDWCDFNTICEFRKK